MDSVWDRLSSIVYCIKGAFHTHARTHARTHTLLSSIYRSSLSLQNNCRSATMSNNTASNLALTPHAVHAIITDDSKAADPRFTPLLQVINIKQIPGSDATTGVRYRLILSDGTHFVNGMMASQMSALVASGELQLNGVLQLKSFMRNLIQGQTICILLDVEILSGSVPRIGAPVAFDPNAARPAATTSTTTAAPLYNSTNDTSEQATVSPPAHKKAKSNAGGVSGSSPRNNPYGRF
jgi:hypothetical protein